MLYTDTDSLFLHFFVDYLAKKTIKTRFHLWNAFYLSEIIPEHLSNLGRANAGLHAEEVGHFKNETKGDLIVKFVGLRPKMYLFTVCEASELISRAELPDGCKALSGGKWRGALLDKAFQAR